MMPNPKLGTVTPDVKAAVEAAKGGALEYRAEKAGIIHAGVGKASFSEKDIIENVNAFIETIQKARPAGAKGTFIKKVTLSSTMGPGIKIDLGLMLLNFFRRSGAFTRLRLLNKRALFEAPFLFLRVTLYCYDANK